MTWKIKANSFLANVDKNAIYKLLIGAIFLVVLSIWITRYIWEEKIAERVEQAWIWGPIIIIVWKSLTILVAPLSGTTTYVIAWGLFWVFRWSVYNLIWNAIWMSIWFRIWRIRWIDVIKRFVGKKSSVIIEELTEQLADLKTLTITRIVLFPLEDLINFACGMSKIRFPTFLIVSLIITSIVATIWIWIGDIMF